MWYLVNHFDTWFVYIGSASWDEFLVIANRLRGMFNILYSMYLVTRSKCYFSQKIFSKSCLILFFWILFHDVNFIPQNRNQNDLTLKLCLDIWMLYTLSQDCWFILLVGQFFICLLLLLSISPVLSQDIFIGTRFSKNLSYLLIFNLLPTAFLRNNLLPRKLISEKF